MHSKQSGNEFSEIHYRSECISVYDSTGLDNEINITRCISGREVYTAQYSFSSNWNKIITRLLRVCGTYALQKIWCKF